MPPKGKAPVAKATQKVVEDKTFGLKNKSKSKKVQQYVEQLQKSATSQGHKAARTAEPSHKEKKRAQEEQDRELAALFALAIKQPKVPAGVDPKSVVCEYFRAGQCTKGFKCKFSHDLAVERKGAKPDVFADARDAAAGGAGGEDDGMDDWDQETLEKAIEQKHAAANRNNPTQIVCKHFLEAVEKRLYGWFWACPNGRDCKYRHALPPGYVLKSQMKALLEEQAAGKKSVEEEIEERRAQVVAKTPITEETFAAWRAAKAAARRAAAEEREAERKRKGLLTGREIFAEEGFVATDDAGASAERYDRAAEEEAEIERVAKEAAEAAARARAAAGAPGGSGGGGAEPPPPPPPGAEAQPSAAAALAAAEGLFGGDDDDDDDLDDGDLDALADSLTKAAAV